MTNPRGVILPPPPGPWSWSISGAVAIAQNLDDFSSSQYIICQGLALHWVISQWGLVYIKHFKNLFGVFLEALSTSLYLYLVPFQDDFNILFANWNPIIIFQFFTKLLKIMEINNNWYSHRNIEKFAFCLKIRIQTLVGFSFFICWKFRLGRHFLDLSQGISKLFLFLYDLYFSNILTSKFGIPCSKV